MNFWNGHDERCDCRICEGIRYEAELEERIDDGLRLALNAAAQRHGLDYGLEEIDRRLRKLVQQEHAEAWAKMQALQAKYRSKKKKPIDPGIRRQVLERDTYRCVTCGTHIDLCIDHIVPESKGGPGTLENLQTMCRPCNSAKGTKEA